MTEVIIAGAARTPMGGFQGVFDSVSAADLGGIAIDAPLIINNASGQCGCELARLIGSLRVAGTLKLIIETEHQEILGSNRIANLRGRTLKSN